MLRGSLVAVNDVLKLCDTLDAYRIPTEEEKQMLARKRNPTEPSQADIMNTGGIVPEVVNFDKSKKEREV